MINPENKDRGRWVPFWFWNDTLDKVKLHNQLTKINHAGIKEVIIHPRYGLPPGTYLSKDWFDHVDTTLEKGKELDMKFWLYDEINWPSGTAGGRVTQNLELVAKTCWEHHGKIRKEPSQFRTKYEGYQYADPLSQTATASFIENTHEQYYKRFPQHFGSVIQDFFHDERGMYANFLEAVDRGKLPFSDEGLETTNRELHGDSLHTDILNIYGGQETINREARLRFFESLAQLYVTNLKTMQQWCHDHQVSFIGHLLVEEDPLTLVQTQADPFAALAAFDWAGYDLIGGFQPAKQILAAKFAQSVARTNNKPAVMTETFGAFGHNLNVQEAKRVLRWQVDNGADVIVPHALFYSTRGDRRYECPPSLMEEPLWSAMPELIADFRKANSF